MLTLEQFGGGTDKEDNTKAWEDCLTAFNSGEYWGIFIGEGEYKIPNVKTFVFSNVLPRFYGSGSLKFWKEDTYEPCPIIFDITNCKGFYMNGVNTKAPHNAILTKDPLEYKLFNSRVQGSTDISEAPVVALLNNESDFGLGTVNFSGMNDPDTLLASPAYGFIYQENFNVKGIRLMNFNANWSGGGVYWGTQNCRMTTGSQSQYFINEQDMNVSFAQDMEMTFSKPRNLWPEREAYTSRSSILQVYGNGSDVFTFILPNELQIQTYCEQIEGRDSDPTINSEGEYTKKMAGLIPVVGELITLQREYETNLSYDEMKNKYMIPDLKLLDYSCGDLEPAVRSHICYTTTEQAYGNKLEITGDSGKYLQCGDVVEDISTGVLHTVKNVSRGYYVVSYGSNQSGYCMEYKPFANDAECIAAGFEKKPDAFVYQNYVLDPPLPNDGRNLVQFEVKESRSSYLMNGDDFKCSMKWMSNEQWTQKKDEVIAASTSAKAHTFYNQRELNHDHRDSDFSGTDYRENNMNYSGSKFDLDGEVVRSLAAYTYFGSQHVNTIVPGGNQYGGGYNKLFPQRDLILTSEGIEEKYKAMQRNIGDVNQGQKVENGYYTTTEERPRPQRLLDFLEENANSR